MRVLGAMVSVFLVLMLWVGFTQSEEQQPEEKKADVPIIEVKTPTYEFQQVNQGETVEHEFQVLNRGTAPLEIKRVKPD